MFELTSLAAVSLLALVCLFGPGIGFQDPKRHEFWMSAIGGASAAFVFVVLLPKLAAAETALRSVVAGSVLAYVSHHSYLLALTGLLAFWALERLLFVLAQRLVDSLARSPGGVAPPGASSTGSRSPLWRPLLYCQGLAFAGYAMLVGYLIVETSSRSYVALLLFSLAMALHYFAMALELRHQIGDAYDSFERWLFAFALLAGWLLAITTEIPYARLALWNSLFAGMLIYFVIRNEIPSPQKGLFRPLFAGALAYSALVLATEWLQ